MSSGIETFIGFIILALRTRENGIGFIIYKEKLIRQM